MLSLRTKVSYGIGQVAESCKYNAFEIFLFFFYTQVLNVSGTLVGLALFIALCVDALSDPLVASISDRCRSRWGRRHPWMVLSIVPLSLAFYCIFTPPATMSELGMFAWLTLFAILGRVSISCFYIPFLALGAELSGDFHERTSLMCYRASIGIGGGLVMTVIAFSVFFKSSEAFASGQLNPHAYPDFALAFALVMALAILISVLGTRARISQLPQTTELQQPFSWRTTLGDMRQVFINPLFRILFISMLLYFVMFGIQATLGLHINTFFWQLTTAEIQQIIMATVFGLLLGTPIAKPLARRFERKSLFIAAVWVLIVCQITPVLLAIGGAVVVGDEMLFPMLLVFSFIVGVCAVQMIIAITTMLADISDAHELQNGKRQQAMLFAGFAFVAKLASGMGYLIAGVGIDMIGFPTDAEPGTVPQQTLIELGLIFGPAAALIGIASLLVVRRY